MKNAPYLLSYAAYISATIHVRVLAQGEFGYDAFQSLKACLSALGEHQYLYSAAKRAKQVIHILMTRSGLIFADRAANNKEQTGQSGEIEAFPGTSNPMQMVPQDAFIWNVPTEEDMNRLWDSAHLSNTFGDYFFADFDIDATVESMANEHSASGQYLGLQQGQFRSHRYGQVDLTVPAPT